VSGGGHNAHPVRLCELGRERAHQAGLAGAPFGLDDHGCGAQAEELGAHPIAGVGGVHFEEQ
jgi:hypothetical protein